MSTFLPRRDAGPVRYGDVTCDDPGESTSYASPFEAFSARYERCFRLVYRYVSRHVSDRKEVEVIVETVLTATIELLTRENTEGVLLTRLKRTTDLELGRKALAPAKGFSASRNRP